MPTRKTDRRTQYTINIVKEAFLELINDHPYSQITVTQVCRQAEITRSTFYLHFNNLTDVLNVVLDDALMISKNSAESLPNISELSIDCLKQNESLLPTCQRIASATKYRALLMDPDLSEYIIGRIASHERSKMIPLIQQRTGLNSQDAETLFNYTLHGSFAINKRHHFIKDDEWYHEVELLNRFINAGYQSFKKN
ncbi:TetR/AcrR family transcriptional regulator [Limosilactobacillus antri]|uniref:Transcriptional regulator n=1 Tax=Limosilactobacillus antri DSM 16041 TaxID=525309 RepID=C8P8A5_9LACO|nr:TetR/AcrR family transcriptional regulator [Limosilactobacillus antri]EEW53266.1 transcriptional regulator, TetR family [Limosilactobacillus antri DSM 16041]KRK59260.1 transcriptional regulator [Limosilactobacillus antri DSM 16041]